MTCNPSDISQLHSEQRLTLPQAARSEGVNPSTVWRWTLRGVRGVQLETFSMGAKRFTTVEAMQRFSERCTAAAAGEKPTSTVRTPRQRHAAIARAERELAEQSV